MNKKHSNNLEQNTHQSDRYQYDWNKPDQCPADVDAELRKSIVGEKVDQLTAESEERSENGEAAQWELCERDLEELSGGSS